MSGRYTLLFSSTLGCQLWAGLPLIWIRFRWLTPPPTALVFTGAILRMLILSPLGTTEIWEWEALSETWKCPEVDLYSKLRPVKLSWRALQMSGLQYWNCSIELSLFISLGLDLDMVWKYQSGVRCQVFILNTIHYDTTWRCQHLVLALFCHSFCLTISSPINAMQAMEIYECRFAFSTLF